MIYAEEILAAVLSIVLVLDSVYSNFAQFVTSSMTLETFISYESLSYLIWKAEIIIVLII